MHSRMKNDLAGRRFGRLVAIEPTDNHSGSNIKWRCRCDCGTECEVDRQNLLSGHVKSCGCFRSERASSVRASRSDYVDGTCLGHLTEKRRADNTSGIKGVSYDKRRGKWVASITLAGKTRNLGRYDTIQEAGAARRETEELHFDPILAKHGHAPTSEETGMRQEAFNRQCQLKR